METGNSTGLGIGFMEDEHAVLVLGAVTTLINACNLQPLANIPRILSKTFLSYLKKWWANILDQMLLNDGAECSQKTHYGFSNIKTHDLAETLFRLSITLGQYTNTCRFDMVKRSIFGPTESDFEYFMLNYWEDSPFLLRRLSTVLNDHDDIFGSFVQSLNSERVVDAILCSFLQGLVSCPPIASDELDILNFLKEVKGGLGCPIIYWQDIRVLKTVEASGSTVGQIKQEVHCIKECTGSGCINNPQFINICNVKKCEEAYHDGYTIALRGMEFRSENIAAIAEGLALLFGQPSVGANVYLTPPRSQGLARHYDDHCVFVCQLLGVKQWTVFSRSTVQLPRLYEPPCSVFSSEGESVATECKQFLLSEGDILYVPRGCPHEACTIAQDGESHIDGGPAGFSLHLTLAIEVEPPFEWEGFAHVALHCWNKNQRPTSCTHFDSLLEVCNDMSINLLHVAIKMVGDLDPTFRKAFMVAALSLLPDNKGEQAAHALDLNQRTTFSYVIDKINRESRFLEVFKTVEMAVQGKNKDFFQRMRWLQHLYQEGERENQPDWNNPLTSFNEPLLLCKSHIEEAENTFVRLKSNFCENVAFDDVCESFRMLLEKYRKTRNQYMNGMLALHCK